MRTWIAVWLRAVLLVAALLITSTASLMKPVSQSELENKFNEGRTLLINRATLADVETAIALLEDCALDGYSPAAALLGKIFKEGLNPIRPDAYLAVYWYVIAATQGNQAALYNVGLLLHETQASYNNLLWQKIEESNILDDLDILSPLGFFQKAYLLGQQRPQSTTVWVTQAAQTAHQIVLKSIVGNVPFTKQALERLWQFGHLQVSSFLTSDVNIFSTWQDFVQSLLRFDKSFRSQQGNLYLPETQVPLKMAIRCALHLLYENFPLSADNSSLADTFSGALLSFTLRERTLDPLHLHMILEYSQEIAGSLASIDPSYDLIMAHLAERYAFDDEEYCFNLAAETEIDGACFNGAASTAVSFYRRAGHYLLAERLAERANRHPFAATHWQRSDQTPRVFHPRLTAQAWWSAGGFQVSRVLKETVQHHLAEIQQGLLLLSVQSEDQLRSTRPPDLADRIAVEGNAEGIDLNQSNETVGFRRIFTPFIGVREADEMREASSPSDKSVNNSFAGWSEFGPLFDGVTWNDDKCSYLLPICQALQQYLMSHREKGNEICVGNTHQEVESLCGADTVVTVLRLRPGAHILPHCGTTNRRLVLHVLLQGGDGVYFRVGGKSLSDYSADALGLSNDQQSFWLANYDGEGPGKVIVFDDSFEHEVVHRGSQDRYILLVLLRHPDDID